MKAIVKQGQTLWDVAIQHCGSADAAFSIARLNNISLTSMPTPGTDLIVPGVQNKLVVNYYTNNAIVPATGSNSINTTGEGIGYWIIGNDFIVQ